MLNLLFLRTPDTITQDAKIQKIDIRLDKSRIDYDKLQHHNEFNYIGYK